MCCYAVIMAGGSGTRFWPASRRMRPKQFLPLGGDTPLLRATCERLLPLCGWEGIRIATGAHLKDETLALLPEIGASQLFVEPLARNTAACLAWSAAVIARSEPEAVIMALPSDAYIADPEAFRACVRVAVECAGRGCITTIGIRPTRPETGYGYVERGEPAAVAGSFEVRRFVEKPDASTAEAFLRGGRHDWNAGMFFYRAGDLVRAVRDHMPALADSLDTLDGAARQSSETESRLLPELFAAMPSVSIDKGVMEHVGGLCVVPGEFGWSDVGSWLSASDIAARDEAGASAPAGTILLDVRDTAVFDLRRGPGDKRVVALVGVEGLVVVETDDALLVVDKRRTQDVKDVVAALVAAGRDDLV